MQRFLFDCHTHTVNSDGHNTLAEMVEGALERGLSVFTVTDHCEIPRYEKDNYKGRLTRCYEEFLQAKERYGNEIKLLFGVEIGQPLDNVAAVDDLLSSFPFDLVLATAHNVRGWKNTVYLDDYDLGYVELLLHAYFDEILGIVRWGRFDVLAHLTYPYRYIDPEKLAKMDLSVFDGKINEIFRLIIEAGKGIEINTAGLFHTVGVTSPDSGLVNRYREMGGEKVTFASDAHRVGRIAQGFDEAMDIMRQAGFDRCCYFEGRAPVFVDIEVRGKR